MNSFDAANIAIQAACGANNELLYDNVGVPSAMVRIPKMTYAELGLGESTAVFPAFIVNGQEVNEIWVSKYQNIVQNGRAYSLPGQDPRTSITLDQSIEACTAKGAGWHVMTAFERAALVLWCEKHGFIPKGNNNYGKHNTETVYRAIPASTDGTHYAVRTATGSGPVSWFHDNSPAGIADLCGNVWEWLGGIRLVYGELQILTNNNAADSSNPQTAASALWKAIDATSGELIAPKGDGLTANSVKADYRSNKLVWATTVTGKTTADKYDTGGFGTITCDNAINENAKAVLRALCMLPKDGDILCTSHACYFRNDEAERCLCVGGSYSYASSGLASFHGLNGRGSSSGRIGFRSAYVKLPPV